MHCRDENGESPVLSQYASANKAMSEATNNSEPAEGVSEATENGEPTEGVSGTTMEPLTFDINSLQFTDARSRKVYVSVNFV